MKYMLSISVLAIALLIGGCKKENNITSNNDEVSFTYNGKNYSFKTFDASNGVMVVKGYYGTPMIVINLPSEFNGTIHYQKTGCAYLQPKNSNISINPGCTLKDHSTSSNGGPIDSMKVSLYFSGSLDLVTSNCETSNGTILGYPVTFTYCDVNGTFDLTLKNKNNETLFITNGVVKVHRKLM